MQKIDDVTDPHIGSTYLVRVGWPEDNTIWARRGALVPLLGPIHEDAELINFPEYHYHVDWRFVSEGVYREQVTMYELEEAHRGRRSMFSGEDRLLGVALTTQLILLERASEFRPRKMLRHHPVFPRQVDWLRKLEQRYQDARMKNWICPHRGISCAGGQIFANGVVCPGHGLMFDVTTGKLKRRINDDGTYALL